MIPTYRCISKSQDRKKFVLQDLQSQKQSVCMSPTVRTDAGVLERRQAERRWSGREQDGVASEYNGALPQRGRCWSSITQHFCVLCYPLQPHCLQAFPTSYSIFHLVFVLKSMNTFCFPIFSTFS